MGIIRFFFVEKTLMKKMSFCCLFISLSLLCLYLELVFPFQTSLHLNLIPEYVVFFTGLILLARLLLLLLLLLYPCFQESQNQNFNRIHRLFNNFLVCLSEFLTTNEKSVRNKNNNRDKKNLCI